jgi:hypothetical protein
MLDPLPLTGVPLRALVSDIGPIFAIGERIPHAVLEAAGCDSCVRAE